MAPHADPDDVVFNEADKRLYVLRGGAYQAITPDPAAAPLRMLRGGVTTTGNGVNNAFLTRNDFGLVLAGTYTTSGVGQYRINFTANAGVFSGLHACAVGAVGVGSLYAATVVLNTNQWYLTMTVFNASTGALADPPAGTLISFNIVV